MIEPRTFDLNLETAADNSFQGGRSQAAVGGQARRARDEFRGFAAALQAAGVSVTEFSDCGYRGTPDSLFPNNWFSTHDGTTIVLYPLKCKSRRRERRSDIVERLRDSFPTVIDLTRHEDSGAFLEGTGSLVLDRVARIAYYNRSQRTNEGLVYEWCRLLNYSCVGFDACTEDGQDIYHTNVVMSVGRHFAVVCTEAIHDKQQRQALERKLEATGKTLVSISYPQMNSFCGNILELESSRGAVIAMSTRAYDAFSAAQKAVLERFATIVHSPLSTIEHFGGGGARCMIAELFFDPFQNAGVRRGGATSGLERHA